MKIWHLKTCDTCRKAIKALTAAGHDLSLIDVRADGVDKSVLDDLVTNHGWETALNRRSTTWRGLSESDKNDITDEKAVALMGGKPVEIYRPQGKDISYHIFLYQTEAEVRALEPQIRALGAIGNDQFIATAPGENHDCVSRVFVPGGGVDEDSVTGSAHSLLTPFWVNRLGRNNLRAYQASERGGELTLRLDGDRAWLGGPCVTVVEGVFNL